MIDLSLRFKPISKLLLQKSHAAINYVRRYFKLSALTEPWLKLKQTTAGELYIKYEGNERGSRGSRGRKGKHSTHARRSTLRSLVRPLAPIFNTLQHAPLRSSKHSRSEIQRGSRDGSRNLHKTRDNHRKGVTMKTRDISQPGLHQHVSQNGPATRNTEPPS